MKTAPRISKYSSEGVFATLRYYGLKSPAWMSVLGHMEPLAIEPGQSHTNRALRVWAQLVSWSERVPLAAHLFITAVFSMGALKYPVLMGVPAILIGHLAWRRLRRLARPRMKMMIMSLIGLSYLMVCLGLFSSESVERTTFHKNAPTTPLLALDLKTDPSVDEQQFLLAVLERAYQNWPTVDIKNPDVGMERLRELRQFMQTYESHIGAHKFDPELQPVFRECLDLIDANAVLVENVAAIDAASYEALKNGAWKSLGNGAAAGVPLALAYRAYNAPQSDGFNNGGDHNGEVSGALVGAVLAVGAVLWDAWDTGSKLDKEKKTQLEGVQREFNSKRDDILQRTRTSANQLAERHSWPSTGLAFSPQMQDEDQWKKLSKENNLAGQLQYYRDRAQVSPMNPFVKAQMIRQEVKLDGADVDATVQLQRAAEFADVAKLIPSQAVYDTYRLSLMRQAGELALATLTKRQEKNAFNSPIVPGDEMAVIYWKTALKLEPTDPNGDIRWNLGVALSCVNLVEEAHTTLNSIAAMRANDPGYHYLLARLNGYQGRTTDAFESLQKALGNGFSNVAEVRKCSDLDKMRSDLPDQTEKLLALKYHWDISYGIFNDDITLTNDSAFTLTDIVLVPEVTNPNGKYKPSEGLKLDKLEPGKSHKWTNCISITGGKPEIDTKRANIECAQGKL
ncbi:MAG: hypothetical protein IPK22_11580 [Verrucomicrobiaceae bacterium]|nr:hypothetical protein [Verrucomicrobiaceae bacterium]